MKRAVITTIAILSVFFGTAASFVEHSGMMLRGAGSANGFKKAIEFPDPLLYHGKGGLQMTMRKVLMVKLLDYEETGANSKHDPNPKKKPSGNGNA